MASISKEGVKKWRIQFMDVGQPGKRRTIRLSGLTKKQAEDVHRHIENIISARLQRTKLEDSDSAWLGALTAKFHAKLVRAGLDDRREVSDEEPGPKPILLRLFLEDHMEHGRTAKGGQAAGSTVQKWKPTRTFLNEVFPDRELASITAEDAHQFRVWLDNRRIKQKTAGRKGQPMTENAKRRHIATCKLFFNAAKRRGLIESNPFESQVSGTQANRSRDHYITPEDAAKLLDAAPDAQWRLLISLWRLAGLRKMEVFHLTWGDVNWEQGKLLVRSTKTAHHEGCEIRFTPIRDVRTYLEDAFQAALPAGKKSVPADAPIITRFSASNSNLDKPFRKIIISAGLVPWPKLFQNLRASCETGWLKAGERADLVANWMGHSVTVQRKNYVQHTDEDIEAFNEKPAFKSGSICASDVAGNDEKRPELAEYPAHFSPSKNASEQRFSTSNGHGTINPTRT